MNEMPITGADIASILVERIERSHPAPALFSSAETDEWPAAALDALLECGIVQQEDRAELVWCPGCEWQCHKNVVVRTSHALQGTEAFITCNEEPDHGRISVPPRSLVQYGATLSGVSRFNLGCHDPRPPARPSCWESSRAGMDLARLPSVSMLGGWCSKWEGDKNAWLFAFCAGPARVYRSIGRIFSGWPIARMKRRDRACHGRQIGRYGIRGFATHGRGMKRSSGRERRGERPMRVVGPLSPQLLRRPTWHWASEAAASPLEPFGVSYRKCADASVKVFAQIANRQVPLSYRHSQS